jgi:hypothetical protein
MYGRLASDDQVFGELAKILRRLAASEGYPDGPAPAQIALLAYHLAHALRVAASPTGGVHASLEYLQLAAGSHAAAASNVAAQPSTSITRPPR